MDPEAVAATPHCKDREIAVGRPKQDCAVGLENRAVAGALGQLQVWSPLQPASSMRTGAPESHPTLGRHACHDHIQQSRWHRDIRRSPRLSELRIFREW